MGMNWSDEAIARLSHHDRHALWNNAKRLGADELVAQIESSGLPFADPKGVTLDGTIGRAMARIICSPAGKAAAIEATSKGRPALAGVDPLLKAEMGDDYAKSYEATIQAGYLVRKLMDTLGYEKSGQQGRWDGGVAKTGEIYIRRK